MAAGLDSSKIRDAAVAQDPLARDRAPDLDLDRAVDRAPVQGIIVVLDPDQGTVGATLRHLLCFLLFLSRYKFVFRLTVYSYKTINLLFLSILNYIHVIMFFL